MNILEVIVSEVKDELFQNLLQKQCLSSGQFRGSFLMEMPTYVLMSSKCLRTFHTVASSLFCPALMKT